MFQFILSVASVSVGYAVAPPPNPLDLLIVPAFQFRIRGTSLDRVRRGEYSVIANILVRPTRLDQFREDVSRTEYYFFNEEIFARDDSGDRLTPIRHAFDAVDDIVGQKNSIEFDTVALLERHLTPINRAFRGLIGPEVQPREIDTALLFGPDEGISERVERGDSAIFKGVAALHSLQSHRRFGVFEFLESATILNPRDGVHIQNEIAATEAKFEAFMQFNQFFEDAWPNHLGNLDRDWPVRRPSKESAEWSNFVW